MAQSDAAGLRRGRVLLIGVIIVLLGTIGVLTARIVETLNTMQAAPAHGETLVAWSPPRATLNLEEAESRARGRARDWASDVYLVRTESAWQPGSGWEDLEQPVVAWSFYYYSPSMQRLAITTVLDEKVTWIAPIETGHTPAQLTQFPPEVGPGNVWQSFRGSVGSSLLRGTAEAIVDLRLMMQDGRQVWQVSSSGVNAYARLVIDSHTGAVLAAEER